ncbi:MAG TPA: helix-turn-helix domain-containing protein [Steroidobacter sp.]|uniref:IclR family transcriptional regulator n=1 Tax=Steroidobacter sp. TaxID=1978227 RepID=UPI002EDAA396
MAIQLSHYEDEGRRSSTVKSVEVTVQILDVLTEATGPVRVGELAKRLGMTKARVSRHLQTLTNLALVDRARDSEGYVFGRKLLKFGRAAVYRSNIVEICRPYLTGLCNATGHTALLATPTRGGAMVVLAVPNQFEPGVTVHPGTLLGLPESPSARLVHYFENQKPTPPKVQENLRTYGVDFEANPRGSGLGGIAAPIFEPSGAIACTVGIILSSLLLLPEPQRSLLEPIRETAREIQASYAQGATSPLMPAPSHRPS